MEMELKSRSTVTSSTPDDNDNEDTESGDTASALLSDCKQNGVLSNSLTTTDNELVHDLSFVDDENCPLGHHLTDEESHLVQEIISGDDRDATGSDGDSSEQELLFEEVELSPPMREKIQIIENALEEKCKLETLKQFALSEYGLVTDEIRRKIWPKLLGIDTEHEFDVPSREELKNHPEYQQVVLDVNRSLKRFPPGIPYEQRVALQGQLTRLILRVIIKYPHLRYYQGYHDVAVTFLLVVGESVAFPIMEKLSTGPLKDCMAATMMETSELLNYIYPLIKRLHPALHDYLERSDVGTLFALPWFLTWFGHNLNKYEDVVRIYDFFLASAPLMPLYLAAVLVVHRQEEIFAVECDMPSIHSLLSQIPDDLPFETLLVQASDLYEKFPPESIKREVDERVKNQPKIRRDSEVVPYTTLPPYHHLMFWRWLQWNRVVPQVLGLGHQAPRRRYARYFVLPLFTTVVAFYAYCKMADAYSTDLLPAVR